MVCAIVTTLIEGVPWEHAIFSFSVGIQSTKQRWNNWQEHNHSIPFRLNTHQNCIAVSEEG